MTTVRSVCNTQDVAGYSCSSYILKVLPGSTAACYVGLGGCSRRCVGSL